ncbi:MAG: peptide deformylase, partial [Microcystis aeruginosa]
YFQRLSFLSYHLGREDPQFHSQIDAIAGYYMSSIFQHEYDHLEGILFLDRLASPGDLYSEEEYQKISNIAEYKR